ncbi:unnamed protein product [Heligmosomoides polygyrus]|uniref:DUF1559 domain-containing protein n=1 Tax=Heligmosomoides polygyrus TaxID=6339 RepID=A0A183FP75_HELPZ|nr:unnamed protein product [Heligmosomoides polygyrus]
MHPVGAFAGSDNLARSMPGSSRIPVNDTCALVYADPTRILGQRAVSVAQMTTMDHRWGMKCLRGMDRGGKWGVCGERDEIDVQFNEMQGPLLHGSGSGVPITENGALGSR